MTRKIVKRSTFFAPHPSLFLTLIKHRGLKKCENYRKKAKYLFWRVSTSETGRRGECAIGGASVGATCRWHWVRKPCRSKRWREPTTPIIWNLLRLVFKSHTPKSCQLKTSRRQRVRKSWRWKRWRGPPTPIWNPLHLLFKFNTFPTKKFSVSHVIFWCNWPTAMSEKAVVEKMGWTNNTNNMTNMDKQHQYDQDLLFKSHTLPTNKFSVSFLSCCQSKTIKSNLYIFNIFGQKLQKVLIYEASWFRKNWFWRELYVFTFELKPSRRLT